MRAKDEALKMDVTQAIDFLYAIPIGYSLTPIDHDRFEKAIDVLSKALEQPAQKPLSDDEINELWKESCEDVRGLNLGFTTQQHYFAWLIEQAHGIGAKE